MPIRQIKIASSTRAVKVISSEAATWGQLKDALVGDYGDLDQMTAVVKETKNSLQRDDAFLPETDFTLYLAPKQIKAGNNERSVAILVSFKEKLNAAIDEMIEEIEDGDFDDYDSSPSTNSQRAELTSEDRAFLSELKSIR